MSPLVSVEEHLAACLELAGPPNTMDVGLLEAQGCVLAEDVRAAGDLPAFDNSSMDGYAVTLDDVAGARSDAPVQLPVVADLPAGPSDLLRLAPGTAVRIMTGAPVPVATGAVVPVEWTDAGLTRVTVARRPEPGQNIRRQGEDVRAGDVVLRSGTRLGPRHLAVGAAVGRARVRIRVPPRVVVVSTGTEVVEPGRPLRFGQLHDANGIMLTALARVAGAQPYRVGIIPDEPATLLAALEDQLVRADVVVSTGGVSAGAYDTVKAVLSRLGTVHFRQVAMQPGKPQGVGTFGPHATPIFTLPGNPVSSYVSFQVFVRPVLRRMLGLSERLPQVRARALVGWRSPADKRQFTRGRLSREGDGWGVQPVGGHGSHLLGDLAHSDCLAVVPEHVGQVDPGDLLECWILEGWDGECRTSA